MLFYRKSLNNQLKLNRYDSNSNTIDDIDLDIESETLNRKRKRSKDQVYNVHNNYQLFDEALEDLNKKGNWRKQRNHYTSDSNILSIKFFQIFYFLCRKFFSNLFNKIMKSYLVIYKKILFEHKTNFFFLSLNFSKIKYTESVGCELYFYKIKFNMGKRFQYYLNDS
ncbi:hypothetical protein BpHYR1_053375, partial [Brachionus plicatilis]